MVYSRSTRLLHHVGEKRVLQEHRYGKPVYAANEPPALASEAIALLKGSALAKAAGLKGKKVALSLIF